MCGRFEQSRTRQRYAQALGFKASGSRWVGGDRIPQYNVAPGAIPWAIRLNDGEPDFSTVPWGYRTPQEASEKKKPWINARIEKALTGRYFRHMFREGWVIVPAGGWYEWTVQVGGKQPWFITLAVDEPIFMAGLTNFKPQQPFGSEQTVEVGFVIVTHDAQGGMVDVHDRRPVVLEPDDAMRWMDPTTSVEDAAHIAHSSSLASEAFTWWKVDRAVNRVDPYNNGKHLIAPIETKLR